jgi:hypothetical protein
VRFVVALVTFVVGLLVGLAAGSALVGDTPGATTDERYDRDRLPLRGAEHRLDPRGRRR